MIKLLKLFVGLFYPNKMTKKILEVPYQSQLDNVSGTGYRECFSSSCAMLAMFHGKIENDDKYNQIRMLYGDSTDPMAQESALREIGLDPRFRTNCEKKTLIGEIDQGRPVAVGWLHYGPPSAPTGGGHWSVVVGYDDTGFFMHDPNGDANLVSGGYLPSLDGECLHYSFKNWLPRWAFPNPYNGWAMIVTK